MCKAPDPPVQKKPRKPEFLRNKYLDEYVGDAAAVKSLKTGRDTLRIPMPVAAIAGRQPAGDSLLPAATPAPTPPAASARPSSIGQRRNDRQVR